MNIKIITDSTSYIPTEYLNEYDISVVSLNVVQEDCSEREVDINEHSFYRKLHSLKELPTSSQPMPEEMLQAFEKVISNGDIAIGIFLSSDMSGTYSSAHLIKDMLLEKYPNAEIHLIDSRTNCMQMGFAAIEAAKAAHANKPVHEVIKTAHAVINNSRFLFTPQTLEYLKKGGRIGGASALVGNLLQIKPILTVENGKTTVLTKVRTHKKALQTMVNTFLDDIKANPLGDIIVHHIHNEEEGLEIAKELEKLIGKKVVLGSIGPVIGLHVGPGSIGIAYYTK